MSTDLPIHHESPHRPKFRLDMLAIAAIVVSVAGFYAAGLLLGSAFDTSGREDPLRPFYIVGFFTLPPLAAALSGLALVRARENREHEILARFSIAAAVVASAMTLFYPVGLILPIIIGVIVAREYAKLPDPYSEVSSPVVVEKNPEIESLRDRLRISFRCSMIGGGGIVAAAFALGTGQENLFNLAKGLLGVGVFGTIYALALTRSGVDDELSGTASSARRAAFVILPVCALLFLVVIGAQNGST